MNFNTNDYIVFFAFIGAVIGISIFMSRKKKGEDEANSEDYFLAGRGLSWWLIGFSLIAANISTEQFIGMSGSAAKWLGLAIASYEWMAAITLVVVAFFFLPKFLRAGIYTIPEFLEQRYNETARSIMAFFMVLIYVFVTFTAVVYSGALSAKTLFGIAEYNGMSMITISCWIIGGLATFYVAIGGLKACAWADLLQGSALIVGGAMILYWAMQALGNATPADIPALANTGLAENAGAYEKFKALNSDKLHMFMPKDDPEIPWTALVVGLWIPNFYYWGLNQYIMQRTLGAKSVAEGQKGIVFAAAMKLIVPFIIVFPGIIAFNLFSEDMITEAIDTNKNAISFLKSDDQSIADFDFAGNLDNYLATHIDNPQSSEKMFHFDDAFAKQYPETANKILEFNKKFSGLETVELNLDKEKEYTPEVLLQKENDACVSTITEKYGEKVSLCQQFIGYKYDSAFALLIKKLVKPGWRGFILVALLGAVMSSLASMLNSASTIFTMDIYKKHINKSASQHQMVLTGRICVVLFAIIGCFTAPLLDDPKFGGVFTFIQEFQGFISPGILAVFVFGLLNKKAPAIAGVIGLLLNPVMYGVLKVILPNLAFLDRMALSFFCVVAFMWVLTLIKPRSEAFEIKQNTEMELTSSPIAKFIGILICVVTVALYYIFR